MTAVFVIAVRVAAAEAVILQVRFVVMMVMVIAAIVAMLVEGLTLAMPIMGMGLVRVRTRVGTAFRLERRFDGHDSSAKRCDQMFNSPIAPESDAIRQDLHREVTVAQRPGNTRQRWNIRPHFQQRFGFGHNLDDVAAIE